MSNKTLTESEIRVKLVAAKAELERVNKVLKDVEIKVGRYESVLAVFDEQVEVAEEENKEPRVLTMKEKNEARLNLATEALRNLGGSAHYSSIFEEMESLGFDEDVTDQAIYVFLKRQETPGIDFLGRGLFRLKPGPEDFYKKDRHIDEYIDF